MPDKLTIECVVAVSISDCDKAAEFSGKIRSFLTENSLQVGNDTIEFFLANYIEEHGSLSIDFKKISGSPLAESLNRRPPFN